MEPSKVSLLLFEDSFSKVPLLFPLLHVFLCAYDNLIYDYTPLVTFLIAWFLLLFSHLALTLNTSNATVAHQEVLAAIVLLQRR